MGGSKRRGTEEDIEMGGRQGGGWSAPMSTTTSNEYSKAEAPTELDEKETDYQPVDWKKVLLTPKYAALWVVLIIIGALTALISLKHDQVVEALRPFAEKVRDIPAGWLIFVAVLFVISFPPLFGHELVALLAGVVYGLWIGFGVVAAGTFIGEIGTWYAFKQFLRKKAEKMERTNLTYGAMAKMCRDGGFWIVFVIRLSIIPSHMSTAVFSTCDVKFWHFAVSTFFTLPKQLILVYLGVLLVGGKSDFWVKFALFGGAGGVTVGAGVWLWIKMVKIKKELLAEQELRRQRNGLNRNNSYNNAAAAAAAYNNNTVLLGASQANLAGNYDNLTIPRRTAEMSAPYGSQQTLHQQQQQQQQQYQQQQQQQSYGYGYAISDGDPDVDLRARYSPGAPNALQYSKTASTENLSGRNPSQPTTFI